MCHFVSHIYVYKSPSGGGGGGGVILFLIYMCTKVPQGGGGLYSQLKVYIDILS